MSRDEFIAEFANILELPGDQLTPASVMSEIESWDSVGYLSAMVMIDEHLGIAITPDILSKSPTFGDIIAAVESAFE